jgi:hypothetical protein
VFPTPWTSDTNMIDGWLARQARKRQVIARANSYSAALKMIAGTDFHRHLAPPRAEAAGRQRPCIRPLRSAERFAGVHPGYAVERTPARRTAPTPGFREQVVKVCADQGLL